MDNIHELLVTRTKFVAKQRVGLPSQLRVAKGLSISLAKGLSISLTKTPPSPDTCQSLTDPVLIKGHLYTTISSYQLEL